MPSDADLKAVESIQVDDGRPAAELVEMYRTGAERLRASMSGMDGDAARERPIEGKMSSLEVLGHICDSEQYLADRIKRTVAMDRPLLMGADGWLYPEPLHYHERDIETQLLLIETTRKQMADDLERLDEEAWSRKAIHSETGLVDLRQLLLHAIRHLEGHVVTIHEKRAALGLG